MPYREAVSLASPPAIAPARARHGAVWALFWTHLLAQPVYALLPERLQGAGTLFIVFSFAGFSFAHLLATRGARAALALASLCLVVAGGLEALSVATGWPFGLYSYGESLGPAVAGVALLVPVCWFMMAYPASRLAELVLGRGAAWAYAPFAALALAAWDLFLDPQMVRTGVWSWVEPGGYAGVPLGNYAGWALTGLLIFAAYRPFARPGDDAVRRDPAFELLPVAAYVWTWFGSALVNAAWWGQPLVALVGGVGMGAFAVPAAIKAWRVARGRRA
jgi:putative membrane protein